ncbi:IncF plasmid conjugative transfer pilus assembly protein TraW [hydrothermal vent metagenome]|uniref:IncF plasmid conjugative transfer pilus assembly protein TraW n=1 Tax=hydrothermal vent metagenome TaxID=652676 RepID=A0A3B0Z446_9ZZZZ
MGISIAIFCNFLSAKDLGSSGRTYSISEQDFLQYIQQKLQQMKQNGKLEALQNKMKKRAIASIMQPVSVKGIITAVRSKTFYFDPSITVSHDIRDPQGRLIQAKGTRINPLDSISMNSILVFVKGDKPAQMTWALKLMKKSKLLVKIILVSGPVIDLMKKHKIRLYFDQKGKLTQRFGITQVPARVYQEGKKLRIDEVLVQSIAVRKLVKVRGINR